LYNILIQFGVPMKLVRLIKMCLNETYSKVRIGKHLSDNFPIQNGLKQGDACRNYRVLMMVYNTQRYWVFRLCPSSGNFLNNNGKNTTFRKLDLFPSSGEGRHLLSWAP
jgi:hypothetical protein